MKEEKPRNIKAIKIILFNIVNKTIFINYIKLYILTV